MQTSKLIAEVRGKAMAMEYSQRWLVLEMARRLENATSIDTVSVVRCKDCLHNAANWQHDELDETDYTDIVCDYFLTDGMYPDDFCSYGARRE